jgi:hypothetical protein
MSLAALYLLALLDAVLIGHHASIGLNPLIEKAAYWRRALWRGFWVGQGSLVIIAAVTGLVFLASPDRAGLLADCVESGAAMLYLLLSYALLVLSGLFFYATRWRLLANVLVLGPFTLLRPFALTAGVAAGILARPRLEIVLILAAAWATTMLVKPLLRRYPPRW